MTSRELVLAEIEIYLFERGLVFYFYVILESESMVFSKVQIVLQLVYFVVFVFLVAKAAQETSLSGS